MLCLASEMGSRLGAIVKIAFQRSLGDSLTDEVRNAQIKMGLTTATSLADNPLAPPNWIDTSTHFLVYSGNLTVPYGDSGTWFEIPLTQPFYYDGSKNLVITFSHQDGSAEANFTTWRNHQLWIFEYIKCLAGAGNTADPPVSPVEDRPNIQLTLKWGDVTITITPPPNPTAGSTGVRIERDSSGTFLAPVVIQNYAPAYTKVEVRVGGPWHYRIRFRNGGAIPSAYSEGRSIIVP
jgi:hypothetical protein